MTRLGVRRHWFLLINSRYLLFRRSVMCFTLDILQEVRPLGVGVFRIRLYTRN